MVVATDVLGGGIDHQGLVSFVHHLQPPVSMAHLQQHLGRARSRVTQTGEVLSVSCGIWWHEDDYRTAACILGPLPVSPAEVSFQWNES